MSERSFGVLAYGATWVGLVALALLSYWCSNQALGSWSVSVALGIAVFKALLILLVFMHLWRAPTSQRLAVTTAAGLLLLLVALMAVDVATRAP